MCQQKMLLVFVTQYWFMAGCHFSSPGNDVDQFTGMWKLYKVEKKEVSGIWMEDTWMKDAAGYIIYDGKGHMAVQIAPYGYNNFDWLTERDNTNAKLVRTKPDSLREPELKVLLTNYAFVLAYFATYTVSKNGDTIEHDRTVHSNPSAWNTKVIRRFRVNRDTLVLELPDGFRRLFWLKQQ